MATTLDPTDKSSTPGQRRSPSLVFGAVSIAIVVLMLTALNQAQPPPPPTAEYAPEAVQALKEAPKEQTSESGIGDLGSQAGGPGPGPGATTTTTEAPATPGTTIVDTKRVRRCIGTPPRQIEDTQSPPCVAYFDGDNGGATWKGVTKDTIRIAVPAEYQGSLIPLFFRFFNTRFELYGRQIVPVGVGGCGGKHPSDMKACAVNADAQKVFASMSLGDVGGNQGYYYDELARRGIVSVSSHPDRRTEADLAANAPHEWSYLPAFDKQHRLLASYICRQLAGGPARNGGPGVITQQRKFGLVSNTYTDAPEPDFTALETALSTCGVSLLRERVVWEPGDRQDTAYQQRNPTTVQQSTSAMLKMSDEGVTSVICVCHSSTMGQLVTAAEAQGYQPEWLITSYAYSDLNQAGSQTPQNQWSHVFGLRMYNKIVEPENEPWYWATQEMNPNFEYENNPFVYLGAFYLYHQMLLLASGLQMAGPNLTPTTFQDGLWKTKFPNPDGPYFEGKVGFADRDHSFVDDAAIMWWTTTGRDPWVATPGQYCYVRRGERNTIGSFPQRDEAFTGRPVCPG